MKDKSSSVHGVARSAGLLHVPRGETRLLSIVNVMLNSFREPFTPKCFALDVECPPSVGVIFDSILGPLPAVGAVRCSAIRKTFVPSSLKKTLVFFRAVGSNFREGPDPREGESEQI